MANHRECWGTGRTDGGMGGRTLQGPPGHPRVRTLGKGRGGRRGQKVGLPGTGDVEGWQRVIRTFCRSIWGTPGEVHTGGTAVTSLENSGCGCFMHLDL
jgi:hypothetical protein